MHASGDGSESVASRMVSSWSAPSITSDLSFIQRGRSLQLHDDVLFLSIYMLASFHSYLTARLAK